MIENVPKKNFLFAKALIYQHQGRIVIHNTRAANEPSAMFSQSRRRASSWLKAPTLALSHLRQGELTQGK